MRRGRGARRLLPALLLAAVPALLISAPWNSRPTALGRAQEEAQLQARGQRLYAQSCASCHGPGGLGTTNGPSLVGVGGATVDFMVSTGRMPMANPGQQPRRSEPAFEPDEIRALVAYVVSLGPGGPEIPEVNPGQGSVSRGRQVFSANCLACHGAGAQGASVGGGRVAPPLDEPTAVQIAEAVRIGPGVMPPFPEAVIPQDDLDGLVAYIEFLNGFDGPGGVELGRVGPVMEGFIAWLIGMGLLVVVIRWIGTRT